MSANFLNETNNFTGVKSFRAWCQKVLPTVYDNSLSYYELLCKVLKVIEEIIKDLDTLETNDNGLREAYTKLENYVNNYFANLNVQEAINTKLDDMAQSGVLDEIIRRNFNKPMSFTQVDRFCRIIKDKGCQGFCVNENKKVGYMALYNYSKKNCDEIVEIDLTTGAILKSHNIDYIYHANSMVYMPNVNQIIICPLIDDSTSQLVNRITIINADTFEIVKQIEYDFSPFAIGKYYNKVDDEWLIKIYSHGGIIRTFLFNELDNPVDTSIAPVKFETINDFKYDNGKYYFLEITKKALHIYDEDFNNYKIYGINNTVNGIYNVGEVEGLDFTDNKIMFTSFCKYNNDNTDILNQCFIMDINDGVNGGEIWWATNYVTAPTLYVEAKQTNNPSGTEDNPFNNLSECLISVYASGISEAIIRVNTSTHCPRIATVPSLHIIVADGVNVDISNFYECENIRLQNAILNSLTAHSSKLYLQNCTVNGDITAEVSSDITFTAGNMLGKYNLFNFSKLYIADVLGFESIGEIDNTAKCFVPVKVASNLSVNSSVKVINHIPFNSMQVQLTWQGQRYSYTLQAREGTQIIPLIQCVSGGNRIGQIAIKLENDMITNLGGKAISVVSDAEATINVPIDSVHFII